MRILAVDDDPVILEMLEQCLPNGRDIELVCCGSAEDALEVSKSEDAAFDCLLLDVMLPGIDGIALCDWFRQSKRYRTTPIIMITASRETDLMERAFHAGATDFLAKPLDGMELRARINAAAMLNASLHREREALHTLAELSERLHLRVEEEVDLEANTRTALGLYFVLLYSTRAFMYVAEGNSSGRASVERVGLAATEGLEGRAWRLAYVGSGRFVGGVMGRARFHRDVVLDEINATLALTWDTEESGTPQPPSLRLNASTEQRLWSGLSASDKIRAHLENTDTLSALPAQGNIVRLARTGQ